MRITTDHPSSSYGQPVILDDAGEVMDYADGVRAIRRQLADTQAEFSARLGVSKRAVESWEYGDRIPSAKALNAIADILRQLN